MNTVFLNRKVDYEIYMQITKRVNVSEQFRHLNVCKIERSLYGIKISPNRWNDRFAEVAFKNWVTLH